MWGQFSQQNAAALEVLRTEASTDTYDNYLSTWLSRDRALLPAEYPQGPRPWSQQPQPRPIQHQHMYQGGYPACDTAQPLRHLQP